MDALSYTKLQLLAESSKLINAVENQQWDLYPALNSGFQQLLKEAIECYGSELNDISDQLFADNDKLQQVVSDLQNDVNKERNSLISSSKALKSYLKDSI